MELPDADSVVRTELQCDIQPGALRQRYFVQWRQIFSDSYIIANERMFNLTLNVSSSQNGSQHQCQVTIDHDGSIIRSYDGVLTTLVTSTALGMYTCKSNANHFYGLNILRCMPVFNYSDTRITIIIGFLILPCCSVTHYLQLCYCWIRRRNRYIINIYFYDCNRSNI